MNRALALLAFLAVPAAGGAEAPRFRIEIEESGVYEIGYEALTAAGLPPGRYASAALEATNGGEPVPLWVDDGGDGEFGSGDRFEFVGEKLTGDGIYHHEYSKANVYQLSFDGARPVRMSALPVVDEGPESPARLGRSLHYEEERLMIRLSGSELARTGDGADIWFWAKLTHIDKQPFTFALALPDLVAGDAVEVKVGLRGLSPPNAQPAGAERLPDHRVEARVDGREVGAAEWNDRTPEVLTLTVADLAPGDHDLELRIRKRRPAATADPVVDVVMLNWIEVVYPSRGEVAEAPLRFESTAGVHVELTAPLGETIAIYGEGGSRIVPAVEPVAGDPGRWRARFRLAPGETSFLAVPGDRRRQPVRIQRDLPSRLRVAANRADYLMIAHARLLEATRPLAEAHRRRGLTVELVDVEDVYDEFGHGIVHPRAIRDFVEYAYRHWERPAPRFVLLVGDASWDTKNAVVEGANYANWPDRQLLSREGFPSRDTPVYSEANSANDRNLIPTWNAPTSDGHAASDNYFVAVEGDDVVPDLAIGRFPVTEPAEVRAIVEKTIRYLATPEVGPWRREVLWITNEYIGFQSATDWLAGELERRGFTANKVYPQPEERDNAEHQRTIQAALERGALLVHFHGHGGRNIWRTGPPDIHKNHDLFTLEHIDELPESGRLPLVLSMTCFSAPFDHPNADSIGEKFLRVAGKGAIAVFAASWRNGPSIAQSRALLAALTVPGRPIGSAIVESKRGLEDRTLVETYNLLGDPAIPLAMPPLGVAVEPVADSVPLAVEVVVDDASFSGRALVDWVDERGRVVASDELATASPRFTARAVEGSAAAIAGARIYVVDERSGLDGIGAWAPPAPPPGRHPTSRRPPDPPG